MCILIKSVKSFWFDFSTQKNKGKQNALPRAKLKVCWLSILVLNHTRNVRAYIEPAINYRLTKQYWTLYENNAIDMVSFLAELKLAGNENTELIILQPKDDK